MIGLFGILALGVFGALASSSSADTAPKAPGQGASQPTPNGPIQWHDGRGATLTSAQRKANFVAVRQLGRALEDAGLFGPGFGELLAVMAYTEARGNPAAGSDAFSNAARGAYGLRPTTAWNEAATVDGVPRVWDESSAELAFANGEVSAAEVSALKDLVWSTALAAHNVSRLRKYTAGGPYTKLGVRRGWAFPYLVPDLDNSERPELLERWNEALAYFNLPASFGDQRMDVLVDRENFPHPAAIRKILLDAIEGKDATTHNQEGFVAGSIEWGTHEPGTGYVYGWALGESDAGPWSWSVDRYAANSDESLASDNGETQSRNLAVEAIIDRVEAWEA